MREYKVRAIGINSNIDLKYKVEELYTYERLPNEKSCYEQLLIWTEHYGWKIIQYIIQKEEDIITNGILVSRLGLDLSITNTEKTKNYLEREKEKDIEYFKNKIKELGI